MPIQVVCTCGKVLKVPDNLAGKRGKCPRCGAVMRIPGGADSGAPAAPPSASTETPTALPTAAPVAAAAPAAIPVAKLIDVDAVRRTKAASSAGPAKIGPAVAAVAAPTAPETNPPGTSSSGSIVPPAAPAGFAPVAAVVPPMASSPFAGGVTSWDGAPPPVHENPYQPPLMDGQSPFAPGAVITATYGAPAANAHELTSFSLWLLLMLNYLTINIFVSIRLLLMHGQMPKLRENDPSAGKAIGFAFIPFFNIFYWSFFVYGRLITRINEQRTMRGLPAMNLHALSITLCSLLILAVIPFVGVLVGSVTGFILFPLMASMLQNGVNQLVEVTRTGETSAAGIQRIIARHNRGFCLLWGLALGFVGSFIVILLGLVLILIAANGDSDPEGSGAAFIATLVAVAIVMVSFWLPGGILLFRARGWDAKAKSVAVAQVA